MEYFNFFNIADQLNAFTFFGYVVLRLWNLDTIQSFIITDPKHQNEAGDGLNDAFKESPGTYAALSIFTVTVLLWALIKIMFFMQVSDDFGLLVRILVESIKNIGSFMGFLCLQMFYFGLAAKILGGEIDGGDDFSKVLNSSGGDDDEMGDIGFDYSGVSDICQFVIVTWRNAIGDLSPPKYDHWLDVKDWQHEQVQGADGTMSPRASGLARHVPTTMVAFAWVFWILSQLLVLIILLNILIAFVS